MPDAIPKPGQYKVFNVASNTYLDTLESDESLVVCDSASNATGQQWVVEKVGTSDQYYLKNITNDKEVNYLSPAASGPENYRNALNVQATDTPFGWIIKQSSTTSYCTINAPDKAGKPTKFVLDLAGVGSPAPDTEVQLWEEKSAKKDNQLWKFIPDLRSGSTYKFSSHVTTILFFKADKTKKQVILNKTSADDDQKWLILSAGQGQWSLKNVSTDSYLGYPSNPKESNPLVLVDSPSPWGIQFLDGLIRKITVPHSTDASGHALAIDVSGNENTALTLAKDTGTKCQVDFHLEKDPTLTTGWYRLVNMHTGDILGVASDKKTVVAGAENFTDESYQKWIFTEKAESFSIENLQVGKGKYLGIDKGTFKWDTTHTLWNIASIGRSVLPPVNKILVPGENKEIVQKSTSSVVIHTATASAHDKWRFESVKETA